jgi:DNA-binding PadR family transcriptional regulator
MITAIKQGQRYSFTLDGTEMVWTIYRITPKGQVRLNRNSNGHHTQESVIRTLNQNNAKLI